MIIEIGFCGSFLNIDPDIFLGLKFPGLPTKKLGIT
jgi:hypothetical protein